ncbi:hypothetical protein Cfor_12601 [Coptotermes formosanus]|jgi:hypothetical protein|uniref:Ribosomal protein mS38 C-terminal domain-containing protein n=1 Tax=Coptotermes formosanus TaxID=36987 RepID=A0A6L2QCY4_COPFO|nr:hypothetical protein Cfor_12601 [Coptotermes formosanus]
MSLYFLAGFMCLGICNSHKYLNSASTELQRNNELSACPKTYSPLQIHRCTPHIIELVKQSSAVPGMSRIQLAQIQHLDLSQFDHRSQAKIELPVISTADIFKLPPLRHIIESNHEPKYYIDAPTHGELVQKQAARLIVIRRRKMKKHKLKKLRIKMKYEWAKVRQRREMRKEKAFQAGLISQIKEAERFDAEKYVAERLQEAHKVPLPRTWKGKRLPFWIIKQKLGIQ